MQGALNVTAGGAVLGVKISFFATCAGEHCVAGVQGALNVIVGGAVLGVKISFFATCAGEHCVAGVRGTAKKPTGGMAAGCGVLSIETSSMTLKRDWATMCAGVLG